MAPCSRLLIAGLTAHVHHTSKHTADVARWSLGCARTGVSPGWVVTLWRGSTLLSTPGRLGHLLPAAGHRGRGPPASAAQFHHGLPGNKNEECGLLSLSVRDCVQSGGLRTAEYLAGVAGAAVAPGQTFVVLAAEGLATALLAWRARAGAASVQYSTEQHRTHASLFVAGMPLAVSDLFALQLACECSGALYLHSRAKQCTH